MNPIASYYSAQSPYTEPAEFAEMLRSAGTTPSEIFEFTHRLLIHPTVAKELGVRANYSDETRNHVFTRTARDILSHPKVSAILRMAEAPLRTC